jgi:hypothetical protein
VQAIETPRIAFAPSFAGFKMGQLKRDTFIWSSIKINQELVNGFLIFNINVTLNQCRSNDIIDICNCFCDAYDKEFFHFFRVIPFPSHLVPLSRNSSASWTPVEAPDGTAALCNPVS